MSEPTPETTADGEATDTAEAIDATASRATEQGALIPVIDLSELGIEGPVGSGGEGTVYLLNSPSGSVFKRYHVDSVDYRALARLVAHRNALAERDRKAIDAVCAWPTAIVTEGPDRRPVGCLMSEVPGDFYARTTVGRNTLMELQHLIYAESKRSAVHLPEMSIELRLLLLARLAEVFHRLHRAGVVVGDVSMKNILWTNRPEPAVFLIDADSFTRARKRGALPPKQTPDWTDPGWPGAPTVASDSYKFGLAVVRVLTGDYHAGPARSLPEVPAPADGVQLRALLDRCLSRTGRPSPAEWLVALGGTARRHASLTAEERRLLYRRQALSRLAAAAPITLTVERSIGTAAMALYWPESTLIDGARIETDGPSRRVVDVARSTRPVRLTLDAEATSVRVLPLANAALGRQPELDDACAITVRLRRDSRR